MSRRLQSLPPSNQRGRGKSSATDKRSFKLRFKPIRLGSCWKPRHVTAFCVISLIFEKTVLSPSGPDSSRKSKDSLCLSAQRLPSQPKGLETALVWIKNHQRVFVGYDQRAGGNWSGDYLIADWDAIEQAEDARKIRVHRVKEINVCLVSPLAENSIRQPDPVRSARALATSI